MPEEHTVLAIDFGGTKTMVGLVRKNGEVISTRRFATQITDSPEVHFAKCAQAVGECLSETGMDAGRIAGVGVTVPGLADPDEGVLIHAPYAGWRDVRVRELLGRYWPGKPVEIANDVNACALGELLLGKAGGLRHFLWVTISTGIGGGLIIDGKIYEGERLIAGEIGHFVVEWENGRKCGCGNSGCLEAHASGTAIAQTAQECIKKGIADDLSKYVTDNNVPVTAEHVAFAARAGVKTAERIYEQAGMYIGRAFSYAVNLLNPGAIIIGGGVSLSFDLLEKGIRHQLRRSVIGDANRTIPVFTTGLGYEAGLLGAASLVFAKRLSD